MLTGRASIRAEAACRIGLLGPRASFASWALNGALDDPDPNVRAEAAYALIRLGSRSPRLVPVLVGQIERTPEPGRIWMQMARNQPLAWLFGTTSWGWPLSTGALRRNDPVEALMLIRPNAALVVPGLRRPLASPANHVRRAALGALLAVASWTTPPSPELAEELLAVVAADRPSNYPQDRRNLEEPFDERKRAVDALARLDRPVQDRAVAMLAADLRELGTPRSYEVVALLSRLDGGTALAVSALAEHLRDGDDVHRSIALVLLHWIGEPAAPSAPTILRVLKAQDNDRTVPINVRMSWWHTVSQWMNGKPMVIGPVVEGRSSVIALGVKALRAMGRPVEQAAIRDLIAVVQDPNRAADQKRGAIVALGGFGPLAGEAVPVLVALIRAREASYKPGPGARGEWNDPEGLAAGALGRIAEDGNSEVVTTLAGLLDCRVVGIAVAAARALWDLGPKARPTIPSLI
ncbi:MAG: HEAT repeat domain-containing protein [Isosphaeraceae bacterium]